jgi:hypothetical protein
MACKDSFRMHGCLPASGAPSIDGLDGAVVAKMQGGAACPEQ